MKKGLILLLFFVVAGCSGIRPRYHTVMRGDSLHSIARHYDVPLDALKDHNESLVAAGGLRPGTKLYIPFEENPLWNDPDAGRTLASDGTPVAYDLEQAHFSWPVRGPISSHYGLRIRKGKKRPHEGIDISANRGTPVRAARSGHVIYADSKLRGYGKMVIVRHADAYTTVYAHLNEFAVKKGQFVSRGQLVGKVGRTGRATGHHLHFEIRNDKTPVDPMLYLEKRVARN